MRAVKEIKEEIKTEINLEFPDWNNIARLAEEAILSEDNKCEGYVLDEEFEWQRAVYRERAKHEI